MASDHDQRRSNGSYFILLPKHEMLIGVYKTGCLRHAACIQIHEVARLTLVKVLKLSLRE